MARFSHYRRVVVTMREGGGAGAALKLAAELARLLDVELEGVFVEDQALLHLASFPFAREIRLPGNTWRALSSERMVADLRLAAGRAERLLTETAAGLGVTSAFSITRADPAIRPGAGARRDEILVLTEPEAERPDWPLGRRALARDVDTGVLLAPTRTAARRGPIALAERPGAALALAEAIARRAGEDLLLLRSRTDEPAPLPLGQRPTRVRIIRSVVAEASPRALARAASRLRARLLILDHPEHEESDERQFLIRFVERTGMPVLLICPPEDAAPT